jgi:hypothetical protein
MYPQSSGIRIDLTAQKYRKDTEGGFTKEGGKTLKQLVRERHELLDECYKDAAKMNMTCIKSDRKEGALAHALDAGLADKTIKRKLLELRSQKYTLSWERPSIKSSS